MKLPRAFLSSPFQATKSLAQRVIGRPALRAWEGFGIVASWIIRRDSLERKRAEEALRQSKTRFRNFFEQPLLGTAITSPEKGWIAANHRICEILGYSLQELKETDWAKLTHPDDLEKDVIQFNRVLAGEIDNYSLDKRFIRKDGEIIWTSIAVSCVRKFDGTVDYICALMQDITERKQVEEALCQSEEQYRSLVSNIPDVSWTLDSNQRFVFISSNIETLSGYTPDEIYQRGAHLYLSSLHPDDVPKVREAFRALFVEGQPFDVEVRAQRKDGEWRWLQHRALTTYEKNGMRYADGLLSDITERKRAEEVLRQNDAKLKEALLAAQMGAWEWTLETDTVTWDENLYRIAGRDPKLPAPSHHELSQVFAPESLERHKPAVEKALATGTPYELDLEMVRPDGTKRWVIARGEAVRNASGHITRLRGTVQDITERKRAEEELRSSEERLRELVETAEAIVWEADATTLRITFVSQGAEKILGYPTDQWLETSGFWADHVHSEDRQQALACEREVTEKGQPRSAEYRMTAADGRVLWFRDFMHAVSGPEGKVERLRGVMVDITDSKRVEEALRQSEQRYRDFIEHSQEGVWRLELDQPIPIDLPGDELLERILQSSYIAECNLAYARILGLSTTAEVLGKKLRELMLPADEERMESFRATTRGPWTGRTSEFRGRDKSGNLRHLSRTEIPIVQNGMLVRIWGITRDVTELRQAEELLRKSEERFRLFMDNNPTVAWMKDDEGHYIYLSEAYQKSLGVRLEDRLGKTDFEIYPRAIAEEFCKNDQAALAAGHSIEIIEESQNRAGEPCTWLTYKFPIQDASGQVFVAGIGLDITERKRAEEALRESEAELREAHRLARLGNWSMDLKTGQATWSDEVYRMFGLDPSLPSLPYAEHGRLFTPESWRRLSTELEEAVRTGAPYELELETVRADGSRGWILDRGEPVRNADGAITHLRGIAMDITERKRPEEALRESEERFRSLVENATVGIYRTTPEGHIQMANPALVRMLGYESFEELAARNLEEEGFEPDYPRSIFHKLMERDGEVRDLEEAWTRRDGSVIFISESARAFRSKDGKILHYDGIVEDITERKQVEAEKARLVTAIEQSAEAAVITNTSGDIEYVNPAFTRITGYSREEVLGKNPRILKSGKQDPAFYQQLWATILKGEIWQGEIINRRKDGSLYTLQMNIAPVRGEQGKITHFIATEQDITARKLLEQQLIQAQKIEAVGRLAGGVAHDFNNLLTIINGYAELLTEQTSAEDPRRDHLKEILMAGERAAGLTRQLLAFSRRQVLEPRIVDLNGVLADIEKMLRRLIGEDVELVTMLKPDLGRVKVDPGQIEQVVMNLAVNARDAMPEGGKLYVETSNVDVDEDYARSHPNIMPGKFVMVAVSDTGCGMDLETQAHIFEPFFTTKEKGQGTGLGLAMVYGIVKQSGGFIWVYSEPGQGSTFKIYFPCVEEAVATTEPADFAAKPAQGAETVLVVEDEEGVRSLVCKTLKSKGYKVLEATGAAQALQIAEQLTEPIHLLLTDVVMPQIGGKELAKRLSPLRPGTKVLYMSGYTDDAIVRHGILESGTFFLQKPFAPDALVRKVREVLDMKPETLQ